MGRREYLERKLEKRLEWAQDRKADANRLSDESHRMMSAIPFGQPILVGHHSEKRDRNYRNRAWNKMGKAVEMDKLAKHHASAADGIERALENSIFSDDSDAIEALEARIKEREDERARMVTINKLWRKKDAAGLAALGIDLEALNQKLAAAGAYWGKQPHMPYELSNLGGRITADKKRLEAVKYRQAKAAKAEAAPGGVLISESGEWCSVTFAEKPAREILNALREAGFHWGSGSWGGKIEKLPEAVKELAKGGEA